MMRPIHDNAATVIRGSRVHSDPQVSVVIPAYQPTWLDEALDSVRQQTFGGWELIVVDDGSPETVVPRHSDDVVLIRQRNAGPGGARNTGVLYGRGPLAAFLDADDQWHPQKLERQVSLHESQPELVMSFTAYELIDGDRARLPDTSMTQLKLEGNRLPYSYLFYENCIACSSVMLWRDAYQRTPGMTPHRRMGEDYGLWLLLAQLGPVGYLEERLLQRRLHSDSLMSRMIRDGTTSAHEREIYEEILEQSPQMQGKAFVRQALARVDFERAWDHLARQEWAHARHALLSSLSNDPLRAKAWVDFARALLHIRPVRRRTLM